MATTEYFEELKLEIARKHNILLSDDDPILASVTLNERLLALHLDKINQSTDQLRADMEAVTERQCLENRKLAKSIVNKSIQHSVGEISKLSDTLIEQLNQQQESFLRDYKVISDNNSKLKTFAGVCAGLSLLGALMTAGMVIISFS